jgi:MraZ protein
MPRGIVGNYTCTIDGKHRVCIPAKIREQLGKSFKAMCDLYEPCIHLFPSDQWDEYERKINENLKDTADGPLKDTIFGNTFDADFDTMGRIVITQPFFDELEFKKEAVVTGFSGRAKLWPKEKWDERYKKSKSAESKEAARARMIELGL